MKRLVFIHGWGFSGEIFSNLVAHLGDDFEVQIIDLPGYGKCHDNTFPLSLKDVAVDVVKQIDTESILIGWSLGGLIAQQIALDFPAKVQSLILIAATPCFIKKEGWDNAADSILAKQFYQQLEDKGESAISGFYTQLAAMEQQPRKVLQEIKRFQGECKADKDTLLRSLKVLHDTDLRQQLSSINKKITWICGDNDQLVPAQKEMLTGGSSIEIISGAGHVPFISQQEQCLHLIKEAVKLK